MGCFMFETIWVHLTMVDGKYLPLPAIVPLSGVGISTLRSKFLLRYLWCEVQLQSSLLMVTIRHLIIIIVYIIVTFKCHVLKTK